MELQNEELQWIALALVLAAGYFFFAWLDHCGHKAKELEQDDTYQVSGGYDQYYWRKYKRKK